MVSISLGDLPSSDLKGFLLSLVQGYQPTFDEDYCDASSQIKEME